jgi:cytosine/adenosine deaminase-related metal-dependent hydrolase
MKDIVFKGNIFYDGKMIRATLIVNRNKFVDESIIPDVEGTLIPAPVNFHTHIGDSFIDEEPVGGVPEIVGPGGFKMKKIENADSIEMARAMRKSIDYMREQGTLAFIDFRESGIRGLSIVPKFKGIKGIFLTRPGKEEEIIYLLKKSYGFGVSSISDYEYEWLKLLSAEAKKYKKLFAIHFSENKREDIDLLLGLKPDFIVHSIEATQDDLSIISKNNIPIAITPRSNVFFGKKTDYSRMLKAGCTVMMGTDNVFITEPNIWQEAEFLYRYQRNLGYIKPEEILKMITENPRKFARSKGINLGKEKYILFENEFLTAYQIITKPGYYRRRILYA